MPLGCREPREAVLNRLSLSLLGPFAAVLDGETLKFRSNRGQALLVYLVTERALGVESHRRESLMDLLWPGLPQKSAQVNLRQTLYQLRQAMPPVEALGDGEAIPLLQADRHTAGLDGRYPLTSDLERFIALLEGPVEGWQEALELYRADFLSDFFLPDANTFEEWAAARRAAFRRQALETLYRLAEAALDEGDGRTAEEYARRQLAMDNLRESAHGQLMRALALTGQRSQALAQYEEVKQVLAAELGAEPSAGTETLYQDLLSGELLPSPEGPEIVGERRPRAVGPCPYRGLAAFREEDAPFFFGREEMVQKLADAVRRRALVHVLVGSSGSGKSSAVYAGLLPRLRADGGWLIAHTRPGGQPFQATAASLLALLEPDLSEADRLIETQKLGRAMAQGEVALEFVARRALEKNTKASRLLLLLDQFEELYTLCADDGLRRRFLDGLLAAAESSARGRAPPLVFLLTLRADFMGQALGHRPFADALQDASFMIGPMNAGELKEAVEKPADKQGAAFEEGLVERILKDVGQEPGSLPLLEFALTLLWERQKDGWLTHAQYEEIGQVEGALARYADQVLADLEEREREAARQIFVQLVRPGQGTEDTRRVATRGELGDGRWPLVQHLADRRLVVTGRQEGSGQETAEVVHEALIQRWGQLRAWMAADRLFRTWQERLRAALGSWEASRSDEGALLRGGPLAEAEEWLDQKREQLSAAERGYITASVALRQRREEEQEARRRRELENAQRLAETERKRAEEQGRAAAGLRRRAYLLTGAGLIAIALAAVAFVLGQRAVEERRAAEQQASLAFSRELAGASLETITLDPQLSVLLALEAVSTAETREAVNALHQSVQALHTARDLPGDLGHTVYDLALSPDGQLLAAAGVNGALVWDARSLAIVQTILEGERIWSLQFSPDGSLLALGRVGGAIDLWDVNNWQRLEPLQGRAGTFEEITSLSFSPDGTILAAGGRDNFIRIWRVESRERLNTLTAINNYTQIFPVATRHIYRFKLAIHPAGKIVVSGGLDGLVKLWDISTGEELFELLGPEYGYITALAVSPDGSRLVTASNDGGIRIWRFSEDHQDIIQLALISANASGLAFSKDGTMLASIGDKGTASIWDVESGKLLMDLTDPTGAGTDVVFALDGSTLFTAGTSPTVRAWDMGPGRELLSLAGGSFQDIDVSPDGARLATVDESAAIWDLETGRRLVTLPVEHPWQIRFSPEGGRVLTVHEQQNNSNLSVWDAASGAELVRFPSTWLAVWDTEFSPDGSQIVVATYCLTSVWDVATGRFVREVDEAQECKLEVEYSPDGQILAAANWNGGIDAWDPATGGPIDHPGETDVLMDPRIGRPFDTIAAFTVSQDFRQFAAGGLSGTILVWNAESGYDASFIALSGHTGQIRALDFSPDGTRLASASNDGTVRVWDVTEGAAPGSATEEETISRELYILAAHTGAVTDVAFTPDGDHLVSSSEDGTVRVHTLLTGELVDLARARVTRGLTAEECQRYLHLDNCPAGDR